MGWLQDLMNSPRIENSLVSEDPVAKKNREILREQQAAEKKKQETEKIERDVAVHAIKVKPYKDQYILYNTKILIYKGMKYDAELHQVQIVFLEGEDMSKGMFTSYFYNFSGPFTLEQFLEIWISKIKQSRLAFIELHQQMKDLGIELTATDQKYLL